MFRKMKVIDLTGKTDFPPAERAGREGLLAVGGDLSPRRLLRAYGRGIFPWYSEGEPILWWSPDPRFVLIPSKFHVSRSLEKILQRNVFTFSFDRAFPDVIDGCALPRPGQPGTWITADMRQAYVELHRLGYAHSLEAWKGGDLVGGLYGLSLGNCFFAESMFRFENNASKAVLAVLAAALAERKFTVIDCQVPSPHLAAWGARSITRRRYLKLVCAGLRSRTLRGNWGEEIWGRFLTN